MSNNNKIAWTQATWNPVTGCEKTSAGCRNCYAEQLVKRLKAMGQAKYQNGFTPTLHPGSLNEPLKWKNPRLVFLPSMGDLFHQDISFNFIDQVMDVILKCPQHTFQILTKRAERMNDYFSSRPIPENVWLGCTVENQSTKWRMDCLRQLKAPVNFISHEPLLEDLGIPDYTGIDWVIAGGESGNKARKMEKSWVLNIKAQCDASGTAFFFKQWGTWGEDGVKRSVKANGHLLDGAEYQAYPIPKKKP